MSNGAWYMVPRPFFLADRYHRAFPDGMTIKPDYEIEAGLIAAGSLVVAGVDEVGRGPLAGPVTAAAVILDPDNIPEGLNDSKRLSAGRRHSLFDALRGCADICVAHASVAEIDQFNILRASHLAMVRAVGGLIGSPDHVLVDGSMIPKGLGLRASAIVKGDGKSVSIAAASIIAKCVRDEIMVDLAQQHPGYGWEKNMGYPTADHRQALRNLGVTPHHRRSFRPVHNILYQENSVTH